MRVEIKILFTVSLQVVKRITFLCRFFSYIRYSVVQPMFYVPCDTNISVPSCCTSVAGFTAKERCSNKFSLRSHQEMGMWLRVSSTTRRMHYNIGLEGWHYVAIRYSATKIDIYITFGGTACGFKWGVPVCVNVSTKQKVFKPASTLVVAFLSWCLNTHVISPYCLLYIWSSCYLPSL